MQTYLKNTSRQAGESEFLAVRATRADVSKLDAVTSGKWAIVPATRRLRQAAATNIDVKNCRILDGGKLGLL